MKEMAADEYSGHRNLEVTSQSRRFSNWMYKEIFPALKGDILEIGSGLGTYSEKIIQNISPTSNITLTDISPSYLEKLARKFSSPKNVLVSRLDLNCKEDYDKTGYEKFDSIVALNVLEHVENDGLALQQLYKMLKSDGILVLLVPCHKFLYNRIDKNVGHFRRYTKKELEFKISKTPFVVKRTFYFNMLGIVGWYLNGTLAKNGQISSPAFKVFDCFVPLSQYIERLLDRKIGLSIICYLKKES